MSGLLKDMALRQDLLKVGSMLVVVSLLSGKSLKSRSVQMEIGYTLAGFLVYHAIVKKIPIPAVGGYKVKMIIDIVLKVGTISLVSALLAGKSLNKGLAISTGMSIAGFVAHAFLKDMLPVSKIVSHPKLKSVLNSGVAAVFTTVVPALLTGGKMNKALGMAVAHKTAGFAAYDLVLSMFV